MAPKGEDAIKLKGELKKYSSRGEYE